jgi:hypothetical protein
VNTRATDSRGDSITPDQLRQGEEHTLRVAIEAAVLLLDGRAPS